MKKNNIRCCAPGIKRRDFLRIVGVGTAAFVTSRMPVMAGPFEDADFATLVPPDKKLDPDWVKSLFARGVPTVYQGKEELQYIGMPVGGINAGQLYLGGDGKLWLWDIFNQHWNTGDHNYQYPRKQESQIEQGFGLRIDSGASPVNFPLDFSGFSDLTFQGQYPIGTVTYSDSNCPLGVKLEAFSPWTPLDADNSSYPATILHYTVKNNSSEKVDATLIGHLENGNCIQNRDLDGLFRNKMMPGTGMTFLNCTAEEAPSSTDEPDKIFEDWNEDTYQGWTAEGEAFGTGPVDRSKLPIYMGDVGGEGAKVVSSHASAPGNSVGEKDGKVGKLTSDPFTIDHKYIYLWVGGGNDKDKTCVNLIVDGNIAASASGQNDNRLSLQHFDVQNLKGKQAHFEIVDSATGSWGNVGVGRITFTNHAKGPVKFADLEGNGTMGLALLGAPPEHFFASAAKDGLTSTDGTQPGEATAPFNQKLIGAIGRKFSLNPGESTQITFVLAWNFPNYQQDPFGICGRHYAVNFPTALDVAQHVATNLDSLVKPTYLWRETWYDSTLPYWFLDRTLTNISTLATSTLTRFKNGRLYGNEGVGCCVGTCTHVYHYEQAMGRLFPELDKSLREFADFNPKAGFDPETGGIGMRGEYDRTVAVDGQVGCIMRAYRDHQMSADASFLQQYWPDIKKAVQYLIRQDGNNDGILEGPQHNTLDAAWYGKVPWLSGLYIASLHAGEAMALEVGDNDFADQCRTIHTAGLTNYVSQMWKSDYGYFIQVPDPAHKDAVGSYDGCEIGQVFGQEWAFQVGLGRVLSAPETKQALASIWKFNYTPDVGPYRQAHQRGRWYAMAGEAGVLGCTWPFGDASRIPTGYDSYFNECQNGYEYEPAAHMIWEGMVLEGLAIGRSIHDRYHATKRNPWNEVECGDHYARSMASYGLFTAACGYEYHGPKGHLGFAPRLTPGNFRAAFTSAAGWGTFSQKIAGPAQSAGLDLKWGNLMLKTFALEVKSSPTIATAQVNGAAVPCTLALADGRATVTFANNLNLAAGDKLSVVLA